MRNNEVRENFQNLVSDPELAVKHPQILKLLIEYRSLVAHDKIQRNLFKTLINDYVKLAKELEQNLKHVTYLSETDHLTGAFNRLKFNDVIRVEVEKSNTSTDELTIIMLDIDFFKKINDSYGHDAGDLVLVELSDFIKKNIRDDDTFCRWGGEEFIILLPNTKLEKGLAIAERLRKEIAKLKIDTIGSVSCSFGVTSFDKGCSMDEFLKRVDDKLYLAKENGRNRVEG